MAVALLAPAAPFKRALDARRPLGQHEQQQHYPQQQQQQQYG
jgi:hypothetical protein